MPTGNVEILVDNIKVLNEVSQSFPFSMADLSVPVSVFTSVGNVCYWDGVI